MRIFIADLNEICKQQTLLNDYVIRLKREDLKRFKGISSTQRRMQFLIGRMIVYENYGKDFTTEYSGKVVTKEKFISVAHSKNYVIVAISDNIIGIDIEFINTKRDYIELGHFCGFKNINNPLDFYKSFTRYEAIVKAGATLSNVSFFTIEQFLVCIVSSRHRENINWIKTIPFVANSSKAIFLKELAKENTIKTNL